MTPTVEAPTQQNRFDRRLQAHAPDRSLAQRMDALNKANEVRIQRANLKRDLKAKRVQLVTLIQDPPEIIHTMHLSDLMLATPKYGRVKVNKILQQCRISHSKTVGGLSERQRREIVTYLATGVPPSGLYR